MVPTTRHTLALILTFAVLTAPVVAQAPIAIPALLSGQSNACLLSPHLPPGSHVLYCAWGQSIRAWDWMDQEQPNAKLFLDQTARYDASVNVWWQGESDSDMSAEEYSARLQTVLTRAAVRAGGTIRPIILVEIAARPGREHITGVHRRFAASPLIAFIPTVDLPRQVLADGTVTDHFTNAAYDAVTARLIACYRSACWTTQ